jgi:LPS export ABC transporter protein LptC
MYTLAKILISILLIAILAISCSKNEPKVTEKVDKDAITTEQVLHDSRINLSQGGRTTAVIDAKYIEKRFGAKKTIAKDIIAHFYDSTGMETSWLVADSGEVGELSNQLDVWGNVEVNTRDSVKLHTESLKWDQKINKVVTEDYVEIHREGTIVRGYGFVSERTLKEFSIKRQVSGRIENLPSDSAK